jgi:hypothetical protein
MVGIGQHHLGFGLHQMVGGQGLDGGLGSHGHKPRGLDDAMGGMENPGAGMGMAALTLTLEAENTAHGKTRFDKNCCILTPRRFTSAWNYADPIRC